MDHKVIDRFSNKTVLVLGDVMLDKYVWGRVRRISPEAPVPIVEIDRESYAPGGAGNLASNLAALGGKVVLVGVVGDDAHKDILTRELEQRGISAKLSVDNRPTITKMRIMGQRQQLMRVDYEQTHYIDSPAVQRVLELVRKTSADAVIVSDYAKGLITQNLYDEARRIADERKIPLFVDVKPKHKIDYAGATVVKTNHKEACELAGVDEHNGEGIDAIGNHLVRQLRSHVLVTRGEKGVSIFSRDSAVVHVPTRAKQVFDVTGAGDTFLAGLALSFICGENLEGSAHIANYAAGIKVGKIGTATVSAEELRKELQDGLKHD